MFNFVTQLPHMFAAEACSTSSILPDLYAGLRNSDCEVQISSLSQIMVLAGNIIGILMVVAGMVAIGFIIVGGFTYITSSGDPSGIKKAKDIIVNAVIGLVIAMVSFGVVRYITGGF